MFTLLHPAQLFATVSGPIFKSGHKCAIQSTPDKRLAVESECCAFSADGAKKTWLMKLDLAARSQAPSSAAQKMSDSQPWSSSRTSLISRFQNCSQNNY